MFSIKKSKKREQLYSGIVNNQTGKIDKAWRLTANEQGIAEELNLWFSSGINKAERNEQIRIVVKVNEAANK